MTTYDHEAIFPSQEIYIHIAMITETVHKIYWCAVKTCLVLKNEVEQSVTHTHTTVEYYVLQNITMLNVGCS